MKEPHFKIGQENNKSKKNIIDSSTIQRHRLAYKIAKYIRIFVEWGLGMFSLFLFARGIYTDAQKNGIGFIANKIAILLTVGFSVYSWKTAICRSFLSQREEHFFYYKTILAIVIGIFGAIAGNPWLLFFLTSRSLNTHLFVLILFIHLALWGSVFFIENTFIQKAISMYPTIATLIVNIEEIFSVKTMQCTYQQSRKYLLSLSITFFSFCIIGFYFSPHIQDTPYILFKFSAK